MPPRTRSPPWSRRVSTVRANAQYAAHFLSELHDRTGSWEAAIAWYHSAVPGEGEPYRAKVMTDWQGGGLRIAPAIPVSWSTRAGLPADPVVVLLAAAAQSDVRGGNDFTPAAYAAVAYAMVTPTSFARPAGSRRRR